MLTPYYIEGVEQGEQVVTIVDAKEQDSHCAHVHTRGLPLDSALHEGSFKVLTAEDTYTSGGRFSAERMYNLLQNALASAKFSGKRVRTSGIMDWSARGAPGTDELIAYEARVNVLVPQYDCTLLCVYDIAKMSGAMVMDILATHQYVIRRRRILENPYYVPPIDVLRDVLLDGASAGAVNPGQLLA